MSILQTLGAVVLIGGIILCWPLISLFINGADSVVRTTAIAISTSRDRRAGLHDDYNDPAETSYQPAVAQSQRIPKCIREGGVRWCRSVTAVDVECYWHEETGYYWRPRY